MSEEKQSNDASEKEEKKEDNKEEAEKEESVEVPEKFAEFVEKIEKMSVMDMAELVKILEKKFGVSAQAAVVAGAAAAQPGEGGAEGKTTFNIELVEAGSQKIQVIKVVRELTGQGLKDAKDLVDAAPKIIKEGVDKEEAENIKKKLEEAGAKVELK